MARAHSRPTGICHICGAHGPLSQEHVPPQSAFNNRRVWTLPIDEAIRLGPNEVPQGPSKQGGVAMYTLRARCNSITGSWYGADFVNWCYEGMRVLNITQGRASLVHVYNICPLRILKQIVTMFFSVNGDGFRLVNDELVRFVLDKERKFLSPKYRFFVYYNLSRLLRYWGGAGILDIKTGKTTVLSEISFPPFGYVMTIDSDPPDDRLCEVTHFAKYDYSDFVINMPLKLPLLSTDMPTPGDYRDKRTGV